MKCSLVQYLNSSPHRPFLTTITITSQANRMNVCIKYSDRQESSVSKRESVPFLMLYKNDTLALNRSLSQLPVVSLDSAGLPDLTNKSNSTGPDLTRWKRVSPIHVERELLVFRIPKFIMARNNFHRHPRYDNDYRRRKLIRWDEFKFWGCLHFTLS